MYQTYNEDQIAREIYMFGETTNAMEAVKPAFYSNIMYAMAILSDAQEMIERHDEETARQYINKAKYFLAKEEK
jgi:hypothetical protein